MIMLNQRHFKGMTAMSKLIHGDIEKQDLTQFADYVEKMTAIGLLTPDENLERRNSYFFTFGENRFYF